MTQMNTRSITEAAILAFSAILEAMPDKQRVTAAKYARAFIDSGLIDGEETRRLVEGIFRLFDDEPEQVDAY
jgi:hypothetical protein